MNGPRRAIVAALAWAFTWLGAPVTHGEVAADQQQVAVGYQRLETLALRIADAVEASDPARAEQMRSVIAEGRTSGINDRFDTVVRMLERERFSAAQRDQTELATQLEELLRLVMADPSAARREEEREKLEALQRDIRAALREQRSLRARAERGERDAIAERQQDLAEKVQRLIEPAAEADRLAGEPSPGSGPPAKGPGQAPGDGGAPGDSGPKPGERTEDQSISGPLESSAESMRSASEKLGDRGDAKQEQRQAQRELEAAQRRAEERLRQLREEEQQRRLASLAERFRRLHEAQTGVLSDTSKRVAPAGAGTTRADRLAAVKLADRQASIASAAEQALRVVRADGKSLVFDQALDQVLGDMQTAESRLRDAKLDTTTEAIEQTIVDALAELIAAVDQTLDELEQQQNEPGDAPPPSGPRGDQGLTSQLAELRLIRSMQARLMRQTEVWFAAQQAKEASGDVVREQLQRLAEQQDALAESAAAIAARQP